MVEAASLIRPYKILCLKPPKINEQDYPLPSRLGALILNLLQ